MPNTSGSNKRIARNTLMLYFRMLLIVAVSLYTSRIVLETLGVEDFGIYNVVGGVVTIMGVLNGAMAVSVQRYLTFELGKGDSVRLKQTFSMCITIFLLFAFLLFVLAETVGLWFLNTQLVIPGDRMSAANWVYQFSILSAIVTLLYTPYNAAIIAHEKMDVFAYVSIMEVMMKLVVAFVLVVFSCDRLVVYGLLLMLTAIVVTVVYVIYCVRQYAECRYCVYWEKGLFIQLLSYSAWNLFGSLSGLAKGQGLNILLNMFFNPVVNTSRGIASQVNTAVTQFFSNFYTAVRPQITKYYAQNDLGNMFKLVFLSSKFSFFLVWIISLPILIETPYIIQLWLGQLPEYVIPFTRLIIVISAVDAMATPLMTTAHATGKIKLYQFVVGTLTILIVPISYMFLKTGTYVVFWISLFISIVNLFVRLWIVRHLVAFPVWPYIKQVLSRAGLITVLSAIVPVWIYCHVGASFESCCLVCGICILSSLVFIYLLGLTRGEKDFIIQIVKNRLKR